MPTSQRLAPNTQPLDVQRLEIVAEGLAHVRPLQRDFHSGLQEAELVTRVVSLALKDITVNGFRGKKTP